MTAKASLIVQLRPSNTTATTAFSPTVPTEITKIVVCNTSGAAATCRMYHDEDGTTYDQTTAVVWDQSIPTTNPVIYNAQSENAGFTVGNGGSWGVESSVANALTFTFYGMSEEVQPLQAVGR